MKISQLRQLIREEIKSLQNPPDIEDKIQQYIKNGSKGNLDLSETQVRSFDSLKRVGGTLDLMLSKRIKSLENIEFIGDDLEGDYSGLQTLGNLKYVGGYTSISHTSIESLGNLEYIGKGLYSVSSKLQSFGNLKKVEGNIVVFGSPIAKKFKEEEIRQQIDVSGEIILKGRGE